MSVLWSCGVLWWRHWRMPGKCSLLSGCWLTSLKSSQQMLQFSYYLGTLNTWVSKCFDKDLCVELNWNWECSFLCDLHFHGHITQFYILYCFSDFSFVSFFNWKRWAFHDIWCCTQPSRNTVNNPQDAISLEGDHKLLEGSSICLVLILHLIHFVVIPTDEKLN